MPLRYENRGTIELDKRDMFKQIKERRKLDSITMYTTPRFKRITDEILEDIEYESYTWTRGDRFYKLAYDFYGNPSYWWVIAMFNNAPTEQHILIGEEIFIPYDLDSVANILEVI